MAEKRLFKELKQLRKTPASVTNPQIVDLSPVDEEGSIMDWTAVIAKPNRNDSPYYYNGQWTLEISAGASYPIQPPTIKFSRRTPINHPNINVQTGEICLDILKSELWSPAWNLEHLVGAVLLLLDDPEPDSPLNVDLANLFRSDKAAFELLVQYTMWQHSTFYDGAKELSGVKTLEILAYDVSSEEEDNDYASESEHEESREASKGPRYHDASSVHYIHTLGREVTEEFLKKATEVESHSPAALSTSLSALLLLAVHQHVSNNVAKQVEEICQMSKSTQPRVLVDEPGEETLKIKESFLRLIDSQVEEIRKLHSRRNTLV